MKEVAIVILCAAVGGLLAVLLVAWLPTPRDDWHQTQLILRYHEQRIQALEKAIEWDTTEKDKPQ